MSIRFTDGFLQPGLDTDPDKKFGSADGDRTRKLRIESPVTLPICLQHQVGGSVQV